MPDHTERELAGIGNWLRTGAARMWATPTDDQRRRIAVLLVDAPIDSRRVAVVAFHAGIG
ncbi:hypothetical protein ACPXB3_06960 [Gordonia sp. DT219]|uniref:hypothetical protein n=1 Tax=Gordonia sp. DT219 TaxID=3416658 RepID=UPI003CF2DE95